MMSSLEMDPAYSYSPEIESRFYIPFDTKIGHFGYVLPRQTLGIVLKKLDLTHCKQTKQEQNSLS